MPRFELVKEPTETWAVFDAVKGVPAEAIGRPLIGMSREAAEQALYSANVGILRAIARRGKWKA